MPTVTAGFRCTGIFPLDRGALLPTPSTSHSTSLSERYGINFIPTYSPACPRLQQLTQDTSLSDGTLGSDDEGLQPATLQCCSLKVFQSCESVEIKYQDGNPEEKCGRL